MSSPIPTQPWISTNSSRAMSILETAQKSRQPVVLLLGAGVSINAGIPLASQLKEYLTQMHQLVRDKGFSNARQYVEEARWPSRHDLRVELMLRKKSRSLVDIMPAAERLATQAAMISEIRREAPMLASSLQEIFGQLDDEAYNHLELQNLYMDVAGLARALGRRSPQNVAYRSLLFHLCDRNQTTIDACLDHFIRDRVPDTTHQFVFFLTRLLNCRVILTTNFDPLLEVAFTGEGLLPRVYEVHGEGSIPSGQLLLSQPLSIVKLHGGAHQLQTGFDLDDPLSPAALSTFADLFRRLQQQAGNQPPLIIAIGYSGSDRRVMDIITNQIREWRSNTRKEDYKPRVLWVNRDPWVPDLLRAAVKTHPEVMQHGDSADNPELYPAHVVRYREGRMFLFEAIQRLKGHFPIARSHYQGVNFVQHSAESESSTNRLPKELNGEWRMSLIHSRKSGEGSSTTLVALADELERTEGTRTIWIDLSEVAGVAALFDVLSERLVKLDSRLHAIRRPPVMQWLILPKLKLDATAALRRSCTHELRAMAQWLRQALRRGRYLLALDSVDEFPSCHPALEGTNLGSYRFERTQRQLFLKLFQELLEHPTLIGDSRIALAVSPNSGQNTEEQNGESTGSAGREIEDPVERLIKDFAGSDVGDQNIRYATPHGIDDHGAVKPKEIESKFNQQFTGRTLDRALAGLVILVSACARRVRSEVMLLRCVSEFIGRLLPDDSRDPGQPSLRDLEELICGDNMLDSIHSRLEDSNNKLSIWQEYTLGGQHKTDLGFPQFNKQILKAIRSVTHYEATHLGDSCEKNDGPTPGRQWIYRTEGGYHWMHRDIRNGLYTQLKSSNKYGSILAAVHHTIALYSYDELYERSRDARSFLEYMFHRIASIRFAVEAGQLGCVCGWLYRLGLALHREKLALLTRARVPGLIHMIAQIIDIVGKQRLDESKWTESEQDPSPVSRLRKRIDSYRNDLRGLMAEFLLASGYPHSAFDSLRRRVFRLEESVKSESLKDEQPVNCVNILHGVQQDIQAISRPNMSDIKDLNAFMEDQRIFIENLRNFRDLAYACQDPLLSAVKFPTLGIATDTQPDWPDRYVEKSNDGGNSGIPNQERKTRLDICRTVYQRLISLSPESKQTQFDLTGSESDPDGDLFHSVIRRLLEFRLTEFPLAWIASAELYWDRTKPVDGGKAFESDHSKYKSILNNFESQTQQRQEELNPDHSPNLYRNAELLSGRLPLLRSSARRRRNECHRLCLLARLKVAEEFSRSDFKGIWRENTSPEEAWWKRILQNMEAAEAILSRNGDPADRQAMAITRLTMAELLLRRAETRLLSVMSHTDEKNFTLSLPECVEATTDHDQCISLLSTVEGLLNEGRGENRWRFFYLLTRARSHMFHAFIRRENYRRQALIDLRWATRYLSGATSNCGLWTDRYDVLGWWWDTWQSLAKSFYSNEPDQFNRYLEEMKALLGIRWGKENYARRDDRWRVF